MRIYLVRHGDAVPEEDAGSDRDRWLSAHGREAARILGRLLYERASSPTRSCARPCPVRCRRPSCSRRASTSCIQSSRCARSSRRPSRESPRPRSRRSA